MLHVISNWFRRYFSDPQAVTLLFLLLGATTVVLTVGHILAPALAGLVIAYLLQGIVVRLERLHVPHGLAVILTFFLFIGGLIFLLLGFVPLLWKQAHHLIEQLPQMAVQFPSLMQQLTNLYPSMADTEWQNVLLAFKTDLAHVGQWLLSFSIASIPTLIMLVIYLFLVPLMVYFFLMDKTVLLNWCKNYFPKNRSLIRHVWREINQQLGNYIRGKALEVGLVGLSFYVLFALLQLPYAMLLAALVGVSVIIPYIGAVLVTVPVVLVGLFSWGWHASFAYLMAGYAILVILDANILVPLLFSEAVNLHPLAIILAILFFGGVWGFWGVFFAIPLAIVIKAVLAAWSNPNMGTTHVN